MLLSCNSYHWWQVFGEELPDQTLGVLAMLQNLGIEAYEPSVGPGENLAKLREALAQTGSATPSVYVNMRVHEEDWETRAQNVIAFIPTLQELDVRVVVTNPEPTAWNGGPEKTDEELERQVLALRQVGSALRDVGISLAYHCHAPEMASGGRELYHALRNVPADIMKFCLDAQWVYRGAGNDAAVLMQVVEEFAERTVCLHLRQSQDGIWTETLGEGDIDYPAIARVLRSAGFDGILTLETCVEEGTPATMSYEEAYRRSVAYTRDAFGLA